MTEDSASRQPPLPETIEFIWQETHGAVDAQLRLAETLDSKAFQAIGVGSVLIGLVALGTDALLSAAPLSRWLLLLAVIVYTLSALSTFLTVNVRRYRLGNRADELWPTQWDLAPVEIKHALVADLAEAHRHNRGELRKKTLFLRAALALLAVEAALIGAAITAALWTTG